jgi:hypothetical protein
MRRWHLTRGSSARRERDAPTTKMGLETLGAATTRYCEIERLRQENERLRKETAEQAKRITGERQLALRHQNSTTPSDVSYRPYRSRRQP